MKVGDWMHSSGYEAVYSKTQEKYQIWGLFCVCDKEINRQCGAPVHNYGSLYRY